MDYLVYKFVDIYTKQAMFDTGKIETSIDFESREGEPHPHKLIFGKAGFSVIWKLLKVDLDGKQSV